MSRWSRARGLSLVMPVAYDFRYALASLAAFYGQADEILLGLDADRVSWSGHPYPFDEAAFRAGLAALDSRGKVRVLEGDFHSQGSPQFNDTHERNVLSRACRPGHWVVQLDSDELAQNPAEFRAWLLQRRWPWLALGRWTVVYKVFGQDYLVVDKPDQWITVASRSRGRLVGSRQTREWKRRSPLELLHFAWGRSEAELEQKLRHWTHSVDFDTARYLDYWRAVSLENYAGLRDLHPMNPPEWPRLRLIRRGDAGWVAPPA